MSEDKNLSVRIVRLPAFTAASYHYIGENPEKNVADVLTEFIRKSGLYKIKPDARLFGFNHPNPGLLEDGLYGYEDWVTIPDDMDIPEPLVKKRFDGGLYAALTIQFPDFDGWNDLGRWVCEDNEEYEPDMHPLGLEVMGGCLEEHVDWVCAADKGWEKDFDGQIDLLFPVKKRRKQS